jgi:hypothetical protein
MEVDASADEEEQPPQRTAKKPTSKNAAGTKPAPKSRKPASKAPEVVNVEDDDEEQMEDGAADLAATLNKANYANAEKERKGAGKHASAREAKLMKENAKLREELERVRATFTLWLKSELIRD